MGEAQAPRASGRTESATGDIPAGDIIDFEDFFENGAIALHVMSADRTILHANVAELDMLGYSAAEYIGHSIREFHVDAGAAEDVLARLATGQKLQKCPVQLRAKDGSVRYVEITCSAQFRDGVFIHNRCFTVDVGELRRARQELHDKDAHLRQVLEALPMAVYTTDPAGKITYFNRAAAEFAGREPQLGKDEWCVTFRLFTPDGKVLPHDQCPMAVALKENRPVRGAEAQALRPDGTRAPFLAFPTPLHDDKGVLVGAVNVLVDIGERKEAETRQRALLDELNHRVKNNMQMLHGLLRSTLRETTSVEAQAVLNDASQRVGAMAAAQRFLYTDDKPRSFSAGVFLDAVCAGARQAFDREITLSIESAPVDLPNDASMPLALILNELLTNAARHGVGQRDTGAIAVALERSDGQIVLSVEDDGPGFDLRETGRRSSGLGLIGGLARQLGGTFTVERGPGARCIVRFPETRI